MLSIPFLPPPQRRLSLLAWIVLAALPVAYVATKVVAASRNIVFWDEFDTALDLILRIDAGADWRELLQRFFAVNNEHRMVTSRLMFAASYWLTGTVNFHVIGAVGNLFLVGACAILVLAVKGWERRIRLGIVLAFLMFQLEHFENFLWSGASIDHFQVVMLGVATVAALALNSRGGVLAAGLLGMLATFTLAHGCLVWPVGACLLGHQRRWSDLMGWVAGSVVVLATFFHGFELNPGHRVADMAVANVASIVRYWLALLGAPLTLGDAGFAPLPGLALLAGTGILVARGALAREPVAMFSLLFAMGALALIAYGRSEIAGPEINSRYMVLGALAWALFIFQLLEMGAEPARPFRLLLCLVPALAAFNISANARFAPMAETFIEARDRAATMFKQYGEDGRGIVRLHPSERHADRLLKMAAERGVYRLPRLCHEVEFPDAELSTRMITHADQLIVNERAVTVGGWAMIPGEESKRGQIYVILRSANSTRMFSTVTLQRSDVARAYNEPKWRLCGFRAVIARDRLPAEDFDVGILIGDGNEAEYTMTPNRLLLAPGQEATALRLTQTR